VLVAVRGTPAAPEIVHRERVQLVDEDRDRFAYHAAVQEEMTIAAAKRHVARVRRVAAKQAIAVTRAACRAHDATRIAVVAKPREIPGDLAVVLAAHTRLHAAEGALYEQALLDAASAAGIEPFVVHPKHAEVTSAIDRLRASVGAPWQQDHKVATAAALQALAR
jgi:hypothetical protein